MAATDVDPHQYAEALRKSLMSDLFEGEGLDVEGEDAPEDYSISDLIAGTPGVLSLAGVESDLEEFQDNEVIKGIMEHGRVLKEVGPRARGRGHGEVVRA